MGGFLKNLLLFIFPVIIAGLVFEYLSRNIPNDYKLKNAYLKENSSNIDVLVLGSSHTFYGVNPKYLAGRAFNAAYVSQSLDYDLKILKEFEKGLGDLEAIVLPISYLSLFDNLDNLPQSWRRYNYNVYYDLPGSWGISDYSDLLGKDLFAKAKRLYLFYSRNESRQIADSLGWGSKCRTKELYSSGLKSALSHYRDLDSKQTQACVGKNIDVLEEFVRWTQMNGVQLILLTTPCHNSYVSRLDERQMERFIELSEDFARDNTHCEYLNLLECSSFQDEDFCDASHLSEEGAKKLSVMINEFMQR